MQSQLLHTMQYAPGLISYAGVTGRWKLPWCKCMYSAPEPKLATADTCDLN